MSTSHTKFLSWASWASLAVPLIAFVLYRAAYTQQWLSTWHDLFLVRRYTFLVSAIVVAFILFGDVGFKRWRLLWLPLAALVLTCYLFAMTYADFYF